MKREQPFCSVTLESCNILLIVLSFCLLSLNVFASDKNKELDESIVPTKVSVGLFVFDISRIDNAQQTFSVDFRIELCWTDPYFQPFSGNLRRYSLNNVWHPSINFLNARNIEKQLDEFVEIDANANARMSQRYQGEFSSHLNLEDFPFDQQELNILLISNYGPDILNFQIDENITGSVTQFSIAEWSIKPMVTKIETLKLSPRDTAQIRKLASVNFIFPAERHIGYYIWKIFTPLGLIVLMSMAAFWINPAELGAQMTVSTASVITLIAFQFNLGYLLPPVSYLTRMDDYVLGSTILVFLALAESVYSSRMAAKKKYSKAKKFDRWARRIFPLLFLFVIIYSFWL
jgi:hypothetical protein